MKKTKPIYLYLALLTLPVLSCADIAQECLDGSIQSKLKPADRYTLDYTNSTATDSKSGLIWSTCLYGTEGDTCQGESISIDWDKAFDAPIDALTLGKKGWRIPNIIELGSLIDSSCRQPVINTTTFENVVRHLNDYSKQYLWSSTTYYDDPRRVYVINLLTGAIEVKYKKIQKNSTNGATLGKFYTLIVKSEDNQGEP